MEIDRRRFLAATGVLAASALLPARLLAAVEKHTPPMDDLSRWADVRAQFRLSPERLHFSSFFLTSHPKPVRDAIEGFRRALDDDPFHTVEQALFGDGERNLQLAALRDVATYLGGDAGEIAVTTSTTMGLGLVYQGFPLRAGDDLLLTEHDHFVHHEAARLAAERAGAQVRRVRLFEDPAAANAADVVRRIERAIRPSTRIVGVTWVHSSSGVRLPIRLIADAVARANRGRDDAHHVRLVVDGVHGLGAVEPSVAGLGADYFCAGTHKWMFAPRGTGIVWARAENWARLKPVLPSFSSLATFQAWMEDREPTHATTAADVSPGGFQAFEHQWAMGAAFRFHQRIGRARVAARIRSLNDRLKSGLAMMKNVRLRTPRSAELSAGLCCFEVAGMKPDAVVARLLERRVIASASPYRVPYVRLAPSLVNDPAEVDAALRALREVVTA